VHLLYVPSALAVVFPYASARHPDWEKMVAGLCIFWLLLVLSERIDRQDFGGQKVLLL
jgi:hypothetical protein